MNSADDAPDASHLLPGISRALLDSMSEGVSLATSDGTIVYTNSAEDRLFGYESGELMGQHFSVQNAFGPEEQERVFQAVRSGLNTDGVWRGEWVNRRKDGTTFTSTVRVRSIEAEGTQYWLCVRDDSTERQKAEAALRDSQSRLKLAIDAGKMAVWEIDFASNEIVGSAELNRLLGFPEEASPTTEEIRAGYYPGEQERLAAEGQAAIARGDRFIESEFRYVWPNGTPRWLLLRCEILRDGGGLPVRALGVLMDITLRKEAEAALEQQNSQLQSEVTQKTQDRDRIWKLSNDLMLIADFEGTIAAVNPAWTKVLGWEERELLGKSLLDLIHPEDRSATLEQMAGLREGKPTLRFENRFLCANGEHAHLSWSAVPEDGLIHAIGRNVTAEKQQAEALRLAEQALQQAQKMESIGNLTGGVAHDFNNLLQVISGNLQLLRKDIAGHEKAEQRLANALAGVSRGAKLASQLLAFGRRQPLEPKVVNVGNLLRGIDDMLRRSIGESIEIETMVSGGLWNTLVDPGQIENAILNLSINARDAMEDGGKLTIEVGNAFLDDAYARQHAEVTAGQYVVLSVTDTGSGIPPEVLGRVFEPFYSTKPEGQGTGLGLSMVYGLVKQSGGHIKIYSEVGHGTTVKMYLPRVFETEDALLVANEGPVTGGSETILVAEDDEEVRDTVVEMLTELGYKVLKARDAASALTVVESGVPIDLLFSDVVMPGTLKSPDLARKARERLPHLAVLFTSGYTENSIVHGGRLDKGVDLLSKPYTREALARKVRHVLANRAQRLQSAAADRPKPEAEAPTETEKLSVLLIEDDAIIRMSTAEMVRDLGYTVVEAGSAEDARLVIASSPVDVVVTDVNLPGVTGTELARELSQQRPDLPVVFATGADQGPEDLDNDQTFFLRKPYDQQALADVLRLAARKLR
ncbi:MAG TPA: PAS domain S-box protein [Devosiaceae bacterium]|jgi:PAS domain S-box-containing protein|nr:PAS domain S-box protein [Devosiaceae bacterium]